MVDLPERLAVTAVLDPRPRYAGTSHDEATARAMGFRGALLPGVFVWGHATRPAVLGWGRDWLERGFGRARFRRPVYHGDPLEVARGPLQRGATGPSAAVTVTNVATGEVVLDGAVGLTDRALAPPTGLPLRPPLSPRLPVAAGAVPVGLLLGSTATVLTPELVAESLADFHETAPIFAASRLVHSGCLVRKTMGDALANLVLPMPVIFAGLDVQHLAAVPVGAVCRASARIVRAWERGGRHYFETEEWLIADGVPVARHTRQNLYAMTGAPR